MEKFKAAVRAKLANTELNVEELGADLGMSRVQLYRKVKALTGLSPVELIRIDATQTSRTVAATRRQDGLGSGL